MKISIDLAKQMASNFIGYLHKTGFINYKRKNNYKINPILKFIVINFKFLETI